MMFGQAPAAGWFSRLFSRPRSEGAGVVACAAAAPLVVLALAVAADYAKVSHFRSRVQLAADRASVATAEAIARQPDVANEGDVRGVQIADSVFLRHAPRGAGTPVGYAGVAPSNFGSALGYDGVSVDASSTSLARVADLRSTLAR
jgi:Flp pilus assembly protein TadG